MTAVVVVLVIALAISVGFNIFLGRALEQAESRLRAAAFELMERRGALREASGRSWNRARTFRQSVSPAAPGGLS